MNRRRWMAAARIVSVDRPDLREAFDFASSGGWLENSAYVCIDTGEIYWTSMSGELDLDEEPPDDLEDFDRYIQVPHKTNLDLGKDLLLAFIAQELPDDHASADDFLRRGNGYRRVKDLLEAHGMLERWYKFENRASDEAVQTWCEEHGIQLVGDPPAAGSGMTGGMLIASPAAAGSPART